MSCLDIHGINDADCLSYRPPENGATPLYLESFLLGPPGSTRTKGWSFLASRTFHEM